MKIVIATPICLPESGGPARYVSELAPKLAQEHDVHVVAFANDPTPLSGGVLHIVKKTGLLPLRLWRFYQLLKTVAHDADVIYAQGAVAAGLPALLVAKKFKKRLVIKMVGDEAWERAHGKGQTALSLPNFNLAIAPGIYPKILRNIQFLVLRNADLVTTPSKYLAELFKKGYRLYNIPVQVNYNPTELLSQASETRTSFSIAVVNRLTRWKHVEEIIKAVQILKEQFPEVTLTIAGDGPERASLEKLITERNLTNSVTLLGDVPKTEVQKLLATSSVYVLNSSYEGLPFTVLEAFAAKIPVVATSIPGTNELVNLNTGWPTNSENAIPLAEAISEVFTHEAKATEKSETAYELLSKNFTWDIHLKKLEGFFNKENTKTT